MNWKDIDGWFTEEDAKAFEYIVERMPPEFLYLEIGAYKGRSTACMNEIARNADKHPQIYIVDTFAGDIHIGKADTMDVFFDNIKNMSIHIVYCSYLESSIAANDFTNGVFDVVFIDATHTYEAVMADIANYMPKLQPGGIMAGHDIQATEVARAVRESFGDNYTTIGNCWITHKREFDKAGSLT